MKLLSTDSIDETGDNACYVCPDNENYSFSEEELQSIIKVFSLLKKQRDKIANNNLDTQVDAFEPKKNMKCS